MNMYIYISNDLCNTYYIIYINIYYTWTKPFGGPIHWGKKNHLQTSDPRGSSVRHFGIGKQAKWRRRGRGSGEMQRVVVDVGRVVS